MTERPWWQRIFPPVERLTEPGSTTGTAAGVFLAYASPVFFLIALVPLFDGDIWVGLGSLFLAVGSWVVGHRLVGR